MGSETETVPTYAGEKTGFGNRLGNGGEANGVGLLAGLCSVDVAINPTLLMSTF